VFSDAHTRELYADWQAKAKDVVGNLCLAAGHNPDDPLTRADVETLRDYMITSVETTLVSLARWKTFPPAIADALHTRTPGYLANHAQGDPQCHDLRISYLSGRGFAG
jgi:hypothetical protein